MNKEQKEYFLRGFLMGSLISAIAILILSALFAKPINSINMNQYQAALDRDKALNAPYSLPDEGNDQSDETVPTGLASVITPAYASNEPAPEPDHERPIYDPYYYQNAEDNNYVAENESDDDSDAQDRAEFRSACIALSNFMESSYAGIQDGNWASCVATQKRNINYQLNMGGHNADWRREAQRLLEEYE